MGLLSSLVGGIGGASGGSGSGQMSGPAGGPVTVNDSSGGGKALLYVIGGVVALAIVGVAGFLMLKRS